MAAFGRALAPLTLFLVLTATASAQDYNDMSPDQIKAVLPSAHPSAYYILASKLYDQGEADEAVFWFYAGQLRYRTHLSCSENDTGDADRALFGALSDVIGSEINRYAFTDLDKLITTIDEVIAWDAATPNDFTPISICADAHDSVVSGLGDLRTYLAENADEVHGGPIANGYAPEQAQ